MLRRDVRLAAAFLATFGSVCLPAAKAEAARPPLEVPAATPQTAQQQADAFIQKLGDRAIAILADKTTDAEAKNQLFQKLLDGNFDLVTIGRFVIGRNAWQAAIPAQQQEYMQLFEKLVIKIYSDRFALYSGQKFRVADSRPEGQRDYMVKSQILQPDAAQPIVVDWRVRNFGDHLGIIDVIVEGVSMSVTQRQEYGAILQRNDGKIEALIKLMHEQLDRQNAAAGKSKP